MKTNQQKVADYKTRQAVKGLVRVEGQVWLECKPLARKILHALGECPVCKGSGLNHGAQCKPSKKHPTGWKTVECDCVKAKAALEKFK